MEYVWPSLWLVGMATALIAFIVVAVRQRSLERRSALAAAQPQAEPHLDEMPGEEFGDSFSPLPETPEFNSR